MRIVALLLSLTWISLGSIGHAVAADLSLPTGMIPLASPEGQKMFLESTSRAAYWPLSAQLVTQENQAFCGVASLVTVLNSLPIPAPSPPEYSPYHIFTQDDLFPVDGRTILNGDWIAHHGLTLDQIGSLAGHFGVEARVVHARIGGLPQFRRDAAQALAAKDTYVLVNFSRSALSEAGYGHFSPLGAYDATTDRFLILDVARYKYPPAWVDASVLYAALDTTDPSSGSTRGYVILGLKSDGAP